MTSASPRWMTQRKVSMRTSLPWKVVEPLLRTAGVTMYRPTPRRLLVDADGVEQWMASCRVPTDEQREAHADVVRARVLERMAAQRAGAAT